MVREGLGGVMHLGAAAARRQPHNAGVTLHRRIAIERGGVVACHAAKGPMAVATGPGGRVGVSVGVGPWPTIVVRASRRRTLAVERAGIENASPLTLT